MILSLYLTIDIQCVKIRILYSRILLDQKSSGSRPDGTTDNQPLAIYIVSGFLFVARLLLGFEGVLQ